MTRYKGQVDVRLVEELIVSLQSRLLGVTDMYEPVGLEEIEKRANRQRKWSDEPLTLMDEHSLEERASRGEQTPEDIKVLLDAVRYYRNEAFGARDLCLSVGFGKSNVLGLLDDIDDTLESIECDCGRFSSEVYDISQKIEEIRDEID